MGNVKDIVDLAEKLIDRRMPLQVHCLFEGTTPPTFVVVITNVSRGEPVVVKEVRVHFGMKDYTYAFVLSPRENTDLPPKHDAKFHLSYDGCIVRQFTILDHRPDVIDNGTPPETPAHLFLAISKAKPEDSWLEVDFNEFTRRDFLKGKIRSVFEHMLAVGRKARSQQSQG